MFHHALMQMDEQPTFYYAENKYGLFGNILFGKYVHISSTINNQRSRMGQAEDAVYEKTEY